MTLVPFDSQRLDALSLRVLDLCTRLRTISRVCQAEELPPIELHERKAVEWLENLEAWVVRAEAELERAQFRARGSRAARRAQSAQPQ